MAFAARTPKRIGFADSHSNPQSLNRYAYVLNNPIRYTDPSGRWIPETAYGDDEQVLLARGVGHIGVVFGSSYASELRKQTLHRTAEILGGQVTTDPQAALLG